MKSNLNLFKIEDPMELFNQEAVFVFMGNEKVHGKEFELDSEEKNLIFSNEFLKNIYSTKFMKSDKTKQRSTRFNKNKNEIEKIIEQQQTGSDTYIPEELLNNYEVGDVVGEGHYAKVHQCKDINTGMVFALKIIDLSKCANKVIFGKKKIENKFIELIYLIGKYDRK